MGDKKNFYYALFVFLFIVIMGIVGFNIGQDIFSNSYLGIIMAIGAAGASVVYTLEKKK